MKKPDEIEHTIYKIREKRRNYETLRLHEYSRRKQGSNNKENERKLHYHSIPIDNLAAGVPPPRCSDGDTLIKMPQKLSFIDNPESVLSVVKKLSATARNKKTRKVILDYDGVDSLDLAAECLLGIVAMEVSKEHATKRKKVLFQGRYPKNATYKRMIKGIGVIKSLNIKHEFLPKEEENKLKIFSYANRSRRDEVGLDTADTNARVSAKFVDHINACLSENQRQLNVQAKMKLSEYTGEIIGNAEDHSGMHHWYIYGYLDKATTELTCEVVIINFGKSFAQTFEELPKNHYAYKQVEPYVLLHLAVNYFNPKWTKQDLLTLAALQGNISSKNDSDKSTRGQGTVELIEFFQKVYKECTNGNKNGAKMAIVSGNTRIFLDGTYEMKPDSKGRKRLALNASNDLTQKPNPSAITNMGNIFFPGTIIAISFPMAATQTESLDNKKS